ncbi:MAG: glycosyltransferase [Alphaproteobacteria bacterium]|nr:glycosyltransferase [Alphaproteobacteria bacterium]
MIKKICIIFGIVVLGIFATWWYLSFSSKIKVSVVVPVYNSEKYVYECLRSLEKQTLKEIEFIIIDDGSTDSSLEIIKKFQKKDGRFRVYSQENKGVGKTRNRGLKLARGEYIGFVDSDDFVNENYFFKLYEGAKKYDADVSVIEKFIRFDDNRKQINNTFGEDYLPKGVEFTEDISYLIGNVGQQWDKIYKKSFLKKYNIYCLERKLHFEDEWFSSLVALNAKRISFVKGAEYYYRYNPKGITQSSYMNRKIFIDGLVLYDELMLKVKEANLENKKEKMIIDNIKKKIDWYYKTYNKNNNLYI